jgi:hypothetical protein
MSGALRLLIGLGAVVAVAVVAAVAVSATGGTNQQPAQPAAAASSLSRNETCAREVFAEGDFIYVNNFSNDAVSLVMNAIGVQNPQNDMAVGTGDLIATSGAGPATGDKVRTWCTSKSNPILTSAQVSSLMRASSMFDVLTEITMFSTDDTGGGSTPVTTQPAAKPSATTTAPRDTQAEGLILCLFGKSPAEAKSSSSGYGLHDWTITGYSGFSIPLDGQNAQVDSVSTTEATLMLGDYFALYDLKVQGNTAHITFGGTGYSHEHDLLKEGSYTLSCQSGKAALRSADQELTLSWLD